MRRSITTTVIALAAGLALLAAAGCTVGRLKRSSELARASEPLQVAPAGATKRLLVVGDSTAVGTGASTPAASVAGLFAAEHPQWAVVNRGRDGAKFDAVAGQIPAGERFDAVLVMAGGNDVIRLTSEETLRAAVLETAQRARGVSDHVLLMPSGNVGNAPFFFAPVSWLMTRRSQTLHALVKDAAAQTGAIYVNLYQDKADDPFAQEPRRYHAADGLHPSDAGYALWYRQLREQAGAVF
jgi:lysophospholipase L1-like esterase